MVAASDLALREASEYYGPGLPLGGIPSYLIQLDFDRSRLFLRDRSTINEHGIYPEYRMPSDTPSEGIFVPEKVAASLAAKDHRLLQTPP